MTTKVIADKQVINTELGGKTPKQLKPFEFKKGQSGNPKGRPKSILTKRQRLELLSEYAKLNPERVNPVAAIHEHNLMEHVFDEKPQFNYSPTYNFIVQGEKAKEKLGLILGGAKPGEIIEGGEDD